MQVDNVNNNNHDNTYNWSVNDSILLQGMSFFDGLLFDHYSDYYYLNIVKVNGRVKNERCAAIFCTVGCFNGGVYIELDGRVSEIKDEAGGRQCDRVILKLKCK